MHDATAANLAAGETLKEAGAGAALTAVPEWADEARDYVLSLPTDHEFTVVDVTDAVGFPGTSMNKAVGGLILGLAKQKEIVSTGRFVLSSRKIRHASPIRVWRRV